MNIYSLQSTINTNKESDTQKTKQKIVKVPTKTLDLFFDENEISHLDLFILDVEGYETEVLEGYKRNTSVIKYMLVEAWDFKKFKKYADYRKWKFIKKVGNDYLFDLDQKNLSM